MKKSLIALAALATVATAAQAQSSVTIYGVMDVGVGSINNVHTSSTANAHWTGMTTGNEATSRLGFKGQEDLGGGLKANFTLETQILPTTGEAGSTALTTASTQTASTSGSGTSSGSSSVGGTTLFDRQATVGLSGNWGKVDLGRQNQIAYDKLVEFDPRSYGNFAGLGSMGVNKLSRINSAAKYYSPVMGGFQFGAMYGIGGIPGETSAGSSRELFAGYADGPIKLSATYSQLKTLCDAGAVTTSGNINGVTGAANPGQCSYYGSSTSAGYQSSPVPGTDSYKQISVAGSYVIGNVTGIVGYLERSNAAATSGTSGIVDPTAKAKLYWVGAKYQVNPTNLVTVAYYSVNDPTGNTASVVTQKPSMVALDYQYSLSKRTVVYGIAGFVHNTSAKYVTVADNGKVSALNVNNGLLPVTGSNQTGYTVGIKHTF